METQPDLLENAIADYHALLASSRALAGESLTLFQEQITKFSKIAGMDFNFQILRPHFLTRALYHEHITGNDSPLDLIWQFPDQPKEKTIVGVFDAMPVMQEFSKMYQIGYAYPDYILDGETQVWATVDVFPVVRDGLVIFSACEVRLEFNNNKKIKPAQITPQNLPPSIVPIYLIDRRKDAPIRRADPEGCVG
jgi:hypothetical protein